MNTKTFFSILLTGILLASCASKKLPVSNFSTFTIPAAFNGIYLNEDSKLSRLLHIEQDSADFIILEYNGRDYLKVSYETESGTQIKCYKGKLKENFFEIYFSNKRIFIPIIYTVVNVDRIRIGSNNNSNLSIYHWDEAWGMILIMAGGSSSDELEYSFTKFKPDGYKDLIPYKKDGKWGYMDNTQRVVIEPIYEFVRLFEKDIARVKLNGKWGLISRNGVLLTETKYDKIKPFDDYNETKVFAGGKEGYVNKNGKEIIPCIYDEIDYMYDSKRIAKSMKDGKFGYLTRNGIVCPPIFDKANDFTRYICFMNNTNSVRYGKVKYREESFLVDERGDLHRYKCSPDKLTISDTLKIDTLKEQILNK